MASCPGQLVVHSDGSVAYCTEGREGPACAGLDRPHRRGVFTCSLVSDEPCAYCSALSLSPAS
jgi:hypothetical protein